VYVGDNEGTGVGLPALYVGTDVGIGVGLPGKYDGTDVGTGVGLPGKYDGADDGTGVGLPGTYDGADVGDGVGLPGTYVGDGVGAVYAIYKLVLSVLPLSIDDKIDTYVPSLTVDTYIHVVVNEDVDVLDIDKLHVTPPSVDT